jgi:hypothetical protein
MMNDHKTHVLIMLAKPDEQKGSQTPGDPVTTG